MEIENERLRTRCAELAAEIERLQQVAAITNETIRRMVEDGANKVTTDHPAKVGNATYSAGTPLSMIIGAAYMEYKRQIPAQQSPAVAVPEIFRKVIFEQPDEAKELVIGVDDNDCPYFILGTQKFRLDPTVIENRDHAKWYQKQLSIAFEKFTAGAHIQPSPRITEQDAREILKSAINHIVETNSLRVDEWIAGDGRAILNKLNGEQNGQ